MSIGKYFNRGVMALDSPHIGHVVKETDHNLVILGDNDERFDVPISKAREVNNNLVLDMEWTEFKSYSSDASYFKS